MLPSVGQNDAQVSQTEGKQKFFYQVSPIQSAGLSDYSIGSPGQIIQSPVSSFEEFNPLGSTSTLGLNAIADSFGKAIAEQSQIQGDEIGEELGEQIALNIETNGQASEQGGAHLLTPEVKPNQYQVYEYPGY